MAFNNSKTKTWDRQTLNDGDLFDYEFDRVYTNLNDLDGRVLSLNNGVSTLTQITRTNVAGLLQGDIFWDKSNGGEGAIALRAGRYEVLGSLITLNINVSLNPVNNNYGNDEKIQNYWYYTLIDNNGNFRTQLATGPSLMSGLAVNAVSDLGGGNIQINFSSNPALTQAMVGGIFRSDDLANDNAGLFVIDEVNEAGFWIKLKNNRGNAVPAGASPLGSAEIFESVPVLNTPNPSFTVNRQGYYDGYWRILGVDYYDTSRNYRWVRPYKTGYDRGDNELMLGYFDGFDATDTMIVKYRDILRQWGNDYIYDPTNGATITFLRHGVVHCFVRAYAPQSNTDYRGLSLNASSAERQTHIYDFLDFVRKPGQIYIDANFPGELTANVPVFTGDVLRVHTGANGTPGGNLREEQARFTFKPE